MALSKTQTPTRSPRSRITMTAAVSLLFFLSAATGFYILLDNLWGTALKLSLIAHPAVAIAATAWIYLFTLKKASLQKMPRPALRLLILPGGFGAIMALAAYAKISAGGPGAAAAYAKCLNFGFFGALALGVFLLKWSPENRETGASLARRKYYFFTGGILWALWLSLLYTGALDLLAFQSQNTLATMALHRWMAFGMTAVYIAHLYLVRPTLGPEERAATPVGMPARAGLWAALAALIVFGGAAGMKGNAGWRIATNAILVENRDEVDRSLKPNRPVPEADLERIATAKSCGNVEGCHAEILDDFLRSAHNIGAQPKYFQKNVADLVEAVGTENQVICAGCHFPIASLTNLKYDYKHYAENDNFSCLICHAFTEAGQKAPDGSNGWYRIRPPWAHLRMFPVGDGEATGADRLLVRLNSSGHRRAFRKKNLDDDQLCFSCHARQMMTETAKGLNNPKCVLCHMQPRSVLGKDTDLKNHLFPGASVAPALLKGDEETAQIIRNWAEGKIIPSLLGWETLWDTRQSYDDNIKSVPWILISFYNKLPPVPGEDFELYVVSANTGLVHAFPTASLALMKAWLQFEAKTESGRTFCEKGFTNAAGPIPDDAPTLGGYMIDRDGNPIVHNRVWEMAKKGLGRQIMNKKEIRDTIVCKIPPDAGASIHISAQWNYRKVDQKFLDYVYGEGEAVIPPIVAARSETTIKVEDKIPEHMLDPNYMVDPEKRKN